MTNYIFASYILQAIVLGLFIAASFALFVANFIETTKHKHSQQGRAALKNTFVLVTYFSVVWAGCMAIAFVCHVIDIMGDSKRVFDAIALVGMGGYSCIIAVGLSRFFGAQQEKTGENQ